LIETPSPRNEGTSRRDIGKSLEKGWSVPGIVIGSLTTDQPTGTGKREAGVKRGCLVGKISAKFRQYLVVLEVEVIQVRHAKHMRGT
jgi:hypothetical protein